MTPEDSARLITRLAVTWPNYKMPTDPDLLALTVEVWCDELDGIAAPEAVQAVKSLSAEGGKFAPAVGEIRKRALELRQQTTGSGGPPSGAEAWSEVLTLIQRRGYMHAPEAKDCSHPAVHRAIEVFGWMNLCKSETQMADRAHFIKFYEDVANRHRDHMATPASELREMLDPGPTDPMLDGGDPDDEDGSPYEW